MEEVQTEYGDKRQSVCRTAGRELHTKCALRHTGGDISPAFGDFVARGLAGVTIVRSVIRRGRNTGAMTSSRTLRIQSPLLVQGRHPAGGGRGEHRIQGAAAEHPPAGQARHHARRQPHHDHGEGRTGGQRRRQFQPLECTGHPARNPGEVGRTRASIDRDDEPAGRADCLSAPRVAPFVPQRRGVSLLALNAARDRRGFFD